ncbi:MAG TPA: iron-containing alcohol dehydrogenase [Solirubrobacterales bacterium]|nr:iron-containing alcohol dehydrogenase [Solirubrobacterales bacterium]
MSAAGVLRAPGAVLFGWGALEAAGPRVAELGDRVLICTDRAVIGTEAGRALREGLDAAGLAVAVFEETAPELPRDNVEAALAAARRDEVEVVVGFGGGSAIDIAKVTALRLRAEGEIEDFVGENRVPAAVAPVVAVPTTAGTGSEVSPVAVVSDREGKLKVGISSPWLVPAVAICDPAATLTCPPGVTAHSGIDALFHAVESYTARPIEPDWSDHPGPIFRGSNALTAPLALSAIELISGALEPVLADGGDRQAREDMLRGALQAGLSFAQAGNAGAHALQYPIGARTKTPHGLGIGLLGPYVLQYVLPEAGASLAAVGRALGVGADPEAAVTELSRLVAVAGIPASLAELGIEQAELGGLAAEAASIERLLRNSPRTLREPDLKLILEAAWSGDRALLKEPPDVRVDP